MIQRPRLSALQRQAIDLRQIIDMHVSVEIEAPPDVAGRAAGLHAFEQRGNLLAAVVSPDLRRPNDHGPHALRRKSAHPVFGLDPQRDPRRRGERLILGIGLLPPLAQRRLVREDPGAAGHHERLPRFLHQGEDFAENRPFPVERNGRSKYHRIRLRDRLRQRVDVIEIARDRGKARGLKRRGLFVVARQHRHLVPGVLEVARQG